MYCLEENPRTEHVFIKNLRTEFLLLEKINEQENYLKISVLYRILRLFQYIAVQQGKQAYGCCKQEASIKK
jgi:hypothetical protein